MVKIYGNTVATTIDPKKISPTLDITALDFRGEYDGNTVPDENPSIGHCYVARLNSSGDAPALSYWININELDTDVTFDIEDTTFLWVSNIGASNIGYINLGDTVTLNGADTYIVMEFDNSGRCGLQLPSGDDIMVPPFDVNSMSILKNISLQPNTLIMWDGMMWNVVTQTNISSEGSSLIKVDEALSGTSTNPVQNKIVTSSLDTKVSKLSGYGLADIDESRTWNEQCRLMTINIHDSSTGNITVSSTYPNYEMVQYEINRLMNSYVTTIPTSSSGNSNMLYLYHNQDARLGELNQLTITMPTVVTDEIYFSCFSFRSGADATTLTYSSTPLIWRGDDVDSDGAFVPEPNTTYEVSVKNLGVNGIVARVGVV